MKIAAALMLVLLVGCVERKPGEFRQPKYTPEVVNVHGKKVYFIQESNTDTFEGISAQEAINYVKKENPNKKILNIHKEVGHHHAVTWEVEVEE